jgi:hypothetical protein
MTVENEFLEAQKWQEERAARMKEAVAAFEAAPNEQPISDMQVVVVYKARIERVEHYARGGEHEFRFTDQKKDDTTIREGEYLPRNAHAILKEFLEIKENDLAGTLDFLSNTGVFSPLSYEVTWNEFKRWQRFADLVRVHTQLATATIEGHRKGECAEVLKALTGEIWFSCSFFDGSEMPETPAMVEFDQRAMQRLRAMPNHQELNSEMQEGKRDFERRRRELWRWFHQPPLTIEWIPSSKEAEQKEDEHRQKIGDGPWMTEFLLPKKDLRPVILIRPVCTLQAIASAIYADRINGIEWRKCAWEKCTTTFYVGKGSTKKFCGRDTCKNNAHSQALRDRRKHEAE